MQHILDNECSDDFKEAIKLNKMTYQLVLPHNHRRNQAKKAIQTFKDHLVVILCCVNKSFPLSLWDRLLRQAEHTLNMLCPSRETPNVSSYVHLWGQHDYNVNPFAPLGCMVKAHMVPSIRETWAPHTTSGFYVGNAWEHYLCHKIYISKMCHQQICSTVFFKHKHLTMPTITPADALIQAAENLTEAIAGLSPPPSMMTDTIDQLMKIFKQQAKTSTDDATTQRVLKECTQAQRVHTKSITVQASPTPLPPLEVKYPELDLGMLQGPSIISQDNNNYSSPPVK